MRDLRVKNKRMDSSTSDSDIISVTNTDDELLTSYTVTSDDELSTREKKIDKSFLTHVGSIASYIMESDFYKIFINEEVPQEQKSNAHKKDDIRSEKFTAFFKNQLEKIDEDERPIAATIYKALAGFIIKPEKLEEEYFGEPITLRDEFKEISASNKSNFQKFALGAVKTLEHSSKWVGSIALESVQFTVRNSIKQPIMVAVRAVGLSLNTGQYIAAKGGAIISELRGNHEEANNQQKKADIQLKNIGYQANKLARAGAATLSIYLLNSATFASGGLTIPGSIPVLGLAAHTATIIDTASTVKDGISALYEGSRRLGIKLIEEVNAFKATPSLRRKAVSPEELACAVQKLNQDFMTDSINKQPVSKPANNEGMSKNNKINTSYTVHAEEPFSMANNVKPSLQKPKKINTKVIVVAPTLKVDELNIDHKILSNLDGMSLSMDQATKRRTKFVEKLASRTDDKTRGV